MTRAAVILNSKAARERVAKWAMTAPTGTRVEFKEVKRTLEQNAKLWAMLTDVARQVEHAGRRYDTESWKVLFMHALGREMSFLPALDGQTFVPIGHRSSDLSKSEMSELIEFIHAWGAEHGVVFSDQEREAA